MTTGSQSGAIPAPDDLTGTSIGPYEVLSRLATGGMAELLLAKRTGIEGFQKVVVLKRILPHFADNPDFVDMFLHEARLAATLEHPNIVPVFVTVGMSELRSTWRATVRRHSRPLARAVST